MHRLAPPAPAPMTTLALKRGFDIAASALGLVALAPLLVLIALVVKIDTPGPALFHQVRIGRNGRPFAILKFRSMVVGAPRLGGAITVRGDARVTRVGAVLRRHKLDELPQLLNVLRGDMSLVGPRPEVPELMRRYTAHQAALITSVRPGMTDYAALLFRDEAALLAEQADAEWFYIGTLMPMKYRCYERYVADLGLWTDLRIILATLAMLTAGRTDILKPLRPAGLRLPGPDPR